MSATLAVAQQSAVVPPQFRTFFHNLYQDKVVPQAAQEPKKPIAYSAPEKGISTWMDSYGGLHIKLLNPDDHDIPSVKKAIGHLAFTLQPDSLWLETTLPAKPTLYQFMPDSFEIGSPGKSDAIRDTQEKMLKLWIQLNPNKPCGIPEGATHNIGAKAVLIDTAANPNKILVIEEKRRPKQLCLPGGSYELDDQSPWKTALREAKEEAGFAMEIEKMPQPVLVGQIEFPKNQFASAINQVWACRVDNLSLQELNPKEDEVNCAKWVDVQVLYTDQTVDGLPLAPEVRAFGIPALQGRVLEKGLDKGFMIFYAPKV